MKVLTRDNYYSLQTDNVCEDGFPAVFGFEPTPLEAVAPGYLAGLHSYRGFQKRA